MERYLAHLDLRGKTLTAAQRRSAFRALAPWLVARGVDMLAATTEDLRAYQEHLATERRTPDGRPLTRKSQQAHVGAVKALYRWLELTDEIIGDPARPLRIHVPRSRVVVRDPLSMQECTALIQSQARAVTTATAGTHRWAVEVRNLAMLCIALATGRRRSGIQALHVDHVDLVRREVRVEREKGRAGRVLPACGWAIEVLRLYVEEARPVLVRDAAAPSLFLDRGGASAVSNGLMWFALQGMVARAAQENADLDGLRSKRITWHSLRVSFATLLFSNGCDIRSVSELLLHRLLSTTASYTPVPVEELRRVFRAAHPRA